MRRIGLPPGPLKFPRKRIRSSSPGGEYFHCRGHFLIAISFLAGEAKSKKSQTGSA